jgi:hypothetical protein
VFSREIIQGSAEKLPVPLWCLCLVPDLVHVEHLKKVILPDVEDADFGPVKKSALQ